MKVVAFTDLDGTILDKNYSFQKVYPTVISLLSLDVAIVFCSSKTKSEIEFYRKEMNIHDPFVSENGGAIFIPKNYFRLNDFTRETKEYYVFELGIEYSKLRQKIEKITSKSGSKIMGFGDMSIDEIAKSTGLTLKMAEMAKQREYDEPFELEGDESKFLDAAKEEGLLVTKGDRYYHLSGQHNKGDAVSRLRLLYAKNFEQIHTIGVGNGQNDMSLLAAVDSPFFIKEEESIEKIWGKVMSEVKKKALQGF